ncbi:hypothetical protein SEA_LEROY_47 [Gordonia phage Leroy]|nr:hypothetical protein SEA_LEROY_47 [Gordonia phage Leroy]
MPQNADIPGIDLDAIERRWSTDGGMGNPRGAEDYTDAGCRIFAEHGFRDVPALIARIRELEASTRVIHDKMKLEAEEMKRLLDGPGFSPKAYDETHGRFKAYFDAWTELDRHSRAVR